MPSDAHTTASLDAAARAVRDTAGLAEAIRSLVADGGRRRQLHEKITSFAQHGDEMLGRWAAVMLNADSYADVIDRHVELTADVAGLASLLDYYEPADEDSRRRRKSQSNTAIQIQGEYDDDWLIGRVVAITQLAAELDRHTLQLALRIVPVQWWAARLGDAHLGADPGKPQARQPERPDRDLAPQDRPAATITSCRTSSPPGVVNRDGLRAAGQRSDPASGLAVTEPADLRDDGHQPVAAFEDADRRFCTPQASRNRRWRLVQIEPYAR